MKRALLCLSLLLCACDTQPLEVYSNRGAPEDLLTQSTEAVAVELSTPAGVESLQDWLDRDKPIRAELSCAEKSAACSDAKDALRRAGVTFTQRVSDENRAVLRYKRVKENTCDPRYRHNASNPDNLNHPAFGCATAINMLHQVRDKAQFLDPAELPARDGEKAVQTYRQYEAPVSPDRAARSLLNGGN